MVLCDDGAGAGDRGDEGAGGAGGGGGGLQRSTCREGQTRYGRREFFPSFAPLWIGRWVHTAMRRLVPLDKPGCLNAIELNQLHQFFVGCSVEPTLGVEAINDMQSVKEACRSAFEGTKTAPSATQQQASETLRHRLRVYESKQNIIYFFPLYPCEIRQDVRNSVHNWATEARLETRQSAKRAVSEMRQIAPRRDQNIHETVHNQGKYVQ